MLFMSSKIWKIYVPCLLKRLYRESSVLSVCLSGFLQIFDHMHLSVSSCICFSSDTCHYTCLLVCFYLYIFFNFLFFVHFGTNQGTEYTLPKISISFQLCIVVVGLAMWALDLLVWRLNLFCQHDLTSNLAELWSSRMWSSRNPQGEVWRKTERKECACCLACHFCVCVV